MKKKLLTILLTSLVMIGLLGGFVWKMNSVSKQMSKNRQERLEQERDLSTSNKAWEDLNPLDVEPLYLSGSKKNVVTIERDNIGDIYNKKRSAVAEELLTDLKKKGDYHTEKPLWAYNPYGTNPESLYVYFNSDGKCYCRYTISVEDEKIPDFTRTLSNGAAGNECEEHEYQLIGLVPGKMNYIIMKLYNNKNELDRTISYKVQMPESYSGAPLILKSEEGRSKTKLENGLYTVFQDPVVKAKTVRKTVWKKGRKKGKAGRRKTVKKVQVAVRKAAVLLYDNSGVLRGELPVETDARGRNAQIIYDNLVYSWDKDSVAQVNSLGQVVGVLDMKGYSQSGEYAYDGFGSIYMLAEPAGKKGGYRGIKVLKAELASGEVTEVLDLESVLPSSVIPDRHESKGKPVLDSIQVTGTNQLLLSSSMMSSIFKVSNIGSLMPKLDYIIADRRLWKEKKKLRKKVLAKTVAEGETEPPVETSAVESILDTGEVEPPEPFTSQYGQNNMVLDRDSSLAEGQYFVSLLNNNTGRGAAKGSESSYYYRYLVDENAGTYILVDKERLEKNESGGNVISFGDSYLYCRGDEDTFLECDDRGKLIKSFRTEEKLYRVYKDDWKGFWFY